MTTLRVLAVLCLLVGSEARAQYGGMFEAAVLVGAAESSLVVGSLVTAIGSTASLGKTQHGRLPWFVCSYIAGAANLAMAGSMLAVVSVQGRNGSAIAPALGIGHLVLALWNIVVPTVGLAAGPAEQTVAPVVVSGRDRAGRTWGGVGVRVATW